MAALPDDEKRDLNYKQGRCFCFTLNNPKQGDDEIISKMDIFGYGIIGHEIAPTTGTPHYQGYIRLKKMTRFNALVKAFHDKDMKPHIMRAYGDAQSNIVYCSKEDDAPLIFGELKEAKRYDIEQVMNMAKDGKSAMEISDANPGAWLKYHVAIEKMRTIAKNEKALDEMKEEYKDAHLHPWQCMVVRDLEEQDHRKVLWIVDEEGGLGKTWLAKYLILNLDAFYCTGGKASDIAFAYDGQLIVVCDYAREKMDHISYSPIENFKNGLIFSAKYESKTKIFPPAKVVCFSNWRPDVSQLSKDRWDIREISRNSLNGNVIQVVRVVLD